MAGGLASTMVRFRRAWGWRFRPLLPDRLLLRKLTSFDQRKTADDHHGGTQGHHETQTAPAASHGGSNAIDAINLINLNSVVCSCTSTNPAS
jgi:hypothetical protein